MQLAEAIRVIDYLIVAKGDSRSKDNSRGHALAGCFSSRPGMTLEIKNASVTRIRLSNPRYVNNGDSNLNKLGER